MVMTLVEGFHDGIDVMLGTATKKESEKLLVHAYEVEMPFSESRPRAVSMSMEHKPGIRPAAKSVIATQRMYHLANPDLFWHPLMSTNIKLTIKVGDRMELHWEPVDGVLDAGYLKVHEYPKVHSINHDETGTNLLQLNSAGGAELEMIIEQLVRQHGDQVQGLHDVSGAGLIHLLVLANNEQSLGLAMKLFRIRPSLLLCVHDKGQDKGQDYRGMFTGEGSLHILAVNEKEKELTELFRLAHRELKQAEFEELLQQQCIGDFFVKNAAHLGATPLSYAASFGLRSVFETLFVTEGGLLSSAQKDLVINGTPSAKRARTDERRVHSYSAVHAVVASGTTEMFDLLVGQCGALWLLKEGCPRTGPEKLTPLQLAAKLGRKQMFKHLLHKQTIPVWIWGPEAEYQIPMDEIDSADSRGDVTVMEILVAPDAREGAQEFVLDK